MLALFTTGVEINQLVFQQNRFTEAAGSSGLFTAFPSLQSTRPIFNQLLTPKKTMMITGAFGSGKSSAIMLYIMLTNHIHKYTFSAAKDKSSEEYRQYIELNKKFKFPRLKYWYWSIDCYDVNN